MADFDLQFVHTGWRATRLGGLAALPDGRVVLALGGPEGSDPGSFALSRVVLRESVDDGRTWGPDRVVMRGSAASAVRPHGLMALGGERLLLFVGRYGGRSADLDPEKSRLDLTVLRSADGGRSWSAPAPVAVGERYLSPGLSLCRLRQGRIVLPFGYLTARHGQFAVSVATSDDGGETWQRQSAELHAGGGEGPESGAAEPAVCELPDGRLWMLIRAQTGFCWESWSSDLGATWTPAKPAALPSANAPAAVLAHPSGRLVAWNPCVHSHQARHSLALACIGPDDRLLAQREIVHVEPPLVDPALPWGVSHPMLALAGDHSLLLAWTRGDRSHSTVWLARIPPAWLHQDALLDDGRDGLAGWCSVGMQAPALVPAPMAPAPSAAAASDPDSATACTIRRFQAGPGGVSAAVRHLPWVGRGLLRLHLRHAAADAAIILHDSCPLPGHTDSACLQLRLLPDATVHLAAGTPRRQKLPPAGGAPLYSYLAYPVANHLQYPRPLGPDPCTLELQLDIPGREIALRIADGPWVKLGLPRITGLHYLGIAEYAGGTLDLHSLHLTPPPKPAAPTG